MMFANKLWQFMNEKDKNLLRDMRKAAIRARKFTENKSREDLEADEEILGFAVVRAIEIVGEAASKIELQTRKDIDNIAWGDIIGMRNRLAHDYLNVDYDIVWTVVTKNLPELIEQLDVLIADESS